VKQFACLLGLFGMLGACSGPDREENFDDVVERLMSDSIPAISVDDRRWGKWLDAAEPPNHHFENRASSG